MNHIYKVIFNKSTGTFVAVAEYAKGQGKKSTGSAVKPSSSSVLKISVLVVGMCTAFGISMSASAIPNVQCIGTEAVLPDGNLNGIRSEVACGQNAKALMRGAVAIGQSAYVYSPMRPDKLPDEYTNDGGVAVGYGSQAIGDSTTSYKGGGALTPTAIGAFSHAYGDGTVAFGESSEAWGTGAVAIGSRSISDRASTPVNGVTSSNPIEDIGYDFSLATSPTRNKVLPVIGYSAVYAPDYASTVEKDRVIATVKGRVNPIADEYLAPLSIGNIDQTRQIINVAAGSADTDVVNVAQLRSVASVAAAADRDTYFHVNPSITPATPVASNLGKADETAGASGPDGSLAAGLNAQATGSSSSAIGYNTIASGDSSIAIGKDTIASFERAVAIGEGANSTANAAFALGSDALSSGIGSVAIGNNSRAIDETSVIAIGNGAMANAASATSLGANSEAQGNRSTSVGARNESYGTNSSAIGTGNTVTNGYSTAVGSVNRVEGLASTAVGKDNNITGAASSAIGRNNTVEQNKTMVLGNSVTTTQANSVILGDSSTDKEATTQASATLGDTTYGTFAGQGDPSYGVVSVGSVDAERQLINVAAGAINDSSTDAINGSQLYAVATELDRDTYFHTNATGAQQTLVATNLGKLDDTAGASGVNALAAGVEAKASGDSAVAIGYATEVTGTEATAIGAVSKAYGVGAVAIGNYAEATLDSSTAIGANSSAIAEEATAIGTNSAASASGATAVGVDTGVSGIGATGVGQGNSVSADESGGFGYNNIVSETNSYAVGADNKIDQANTFVFGSNVTPVTENAVILGNRSSDRLATVVTEATITSADGTDIVYGGFEGEGSVSNGVVSIGADKRERQLINVATGEISATSTDGINGSQLYSVAKTLVDTGINIDADNGTADTVSLGDTISYTADDSNIITTVRDNEIGYKLANTVTVGGDATQSSNNPVTINGTAGTVTGLTNTTYDPTTIVSGRAATEDQLQAISNSPLTFTGNTNVDTDTNGTQQTLGSTLSIIGSNSAVSLTEDTSNAATLGDYSAKNVQTVVTDGQVQVQLAENPEFDSVTAGTGTNQVILNNDGVNVGGNTYIDNNGINANSNPITNVASGGTTATNAANIGDVNAAKTTVVSSNNSISVTDTNNSGNFAYDIKVDAQGLAESAQLPVVYTNANGDKVYKQADGSFNTAADGTGTTEAAADIIASLQDAGGSTIAPMTLANVADGTISSTSHDAINGSQLFDVSTSTATALGGGAAVNENGTIKAPEYKLTDGNPSTGNTTPYDNVGDALTGLNTAVNQPLTITGNDLQDTNGDGSQQQLGSTLEISGGATAAASNTNVRTVITDGKVDIQLLDAPTFTGKVSAIGVDAGGEKVTNVAVGTVSATSTDAVNGSQLNAVQTSVDRPLTFSGNTNLDTDTTGGAAENDGTQRQLGETLNIIGSTSTPFPRLAEDTTGTMTGNEFSAKNVQTVVTNGEVQIQLSENPVFKTVGLDDGAGNASTLSATAEGLDVGGVRIVNVKAGSATDDAVNLGQLQTALSGINVQNQTLVTQNTPVVYTADLGANETPTQLVRVPDPANSGKLEFYKVSDTTAGVPNTGATPIDTNDVYSSALDANGGFNTNERLTNIKSTLPVTSGSTSYVAPTLTDLTAREKQNAATVDDVLNAGWNLETNTTPLDFITAYDTVDFKDGENTEVVSQVDSAQRKSTIQFDVVTDGDIVVDATTGVVGTPVNGSGIVTAETVSDAIKASGFTLTSAASAGTVSGTSNELIRSGDTITLDAGQNIAVVQAGDKITVSTEDDVIFDSVSVGATNPVVINQNGINAGDKLITNVASGGTTATNAANIGDVNAAKTTVQSSDSSISVIDTNNGNGNLAYDIKLNAQGITELAQLPVVYTNATGDKLYKQTDGSFNTAVDGNGKTFAPDNVITSMQNADGSTDTPTKLTNIADGTIASTSTDAINGSQLFDTNNQVAGNTTALGGGAAYDPETNTYIAPTYTVNNPADGEATEVHNVGDAVDALNTAVNSPLTFTGDTGSFERTLGQTTNVQGGITDATKLTDNNIGVVADNGTLDIKLAEAVNLGINGSVTTGDTVVNNAGISISNGANDTVSLTNAGLDNGGNTITNVASGGTTATNAANIGDVNAAKTTVQSSDSSISVIDTNNGNGNLAYDIKLNAQGIAELAQLPVVYTNAAGDKLYKQTDGSFNTAVDGTGTTEVTADVIASMQNADGSTDTPTKLTNIADGTIANTSTDAINGSQLFDTNNQVAGNTTALGGGAAYDPETNTYIAPTYTVNNPADGVATEVHNVGDAVDALNTAVNSPLTFTGDTGSFERTLGQTTNVQGGITDATKLTDNNIGVVADNGTLDIKLAEAVNLGIDGSVTTGDTVVNNAGISISNGANDTVSLTNTGLDNGGNAITNVANGSSPNDAVNMSQLNSTNVTVAQGFNIAADNGVVDNVKLGDTVQYTSSDSNIVTTVSNNQIDFRLANSLTLGQANPITLNGDTGTISGLTNKTFDADNYVSGQAATEDQLAQVATQASNAAQGWNLSANGEASTVSSVKPTDTVDIANADSNIEITKTGNDIKVGLADNISVVSMTAGNTTINNDGIAISGGANDTVALTNQGLDNGGNVITNVADGTISVNSTEAVNGSQIYALTGGGNTNIGDYTTTLPDGTDETYNNVVLDEEGNPSLVTYNVDDRAEYINNSVISAVHNMNEEGIKFFHTNDETQGTDIPEQDYNNIDASAGGAYSTAIGYQAEIDIQATNAVAIGKESRIYTDSVGAIAIGQGATVGNADTALDDDQRGAVNSIAIGTGATVVGNNSIAIGVGNVVNGDNSGAFGDPSTINADSAYSVGNNNQLGESATNTFVLGNEVETNVENSVALGNQTTVTAGTQVGTVNAQADGTAGNTTTAGDKGMVNTATVGNVTYEGFAGATADGAVSVGASGSERRIQNVAAGEISATSTDAINGSQLNMTNRALGDLGYKLSQEIDDVGDDANAGVSSAMAMAALPQAYIPGKSMVTGGMATYNGEGAVAIGLSQLSDNGRWVFKISGSADTGGNAGGAVGAGFHF